MNLQPTAFPELRGFHIPVVTSPYTDLEPAIDEIQELQQKIDDGLYRLGEIEEEIDDLRTEESDLESRIDDLERDLRDLRKANPLAAAKVARSDDDEPGFRYACTDCSWDGFDSSDSSGFRAGEHSRSTGHKMALVPVGGSVFFAQDRIDLEVQL